jgi:hypothetical protein
MTESLIPAGTVVDFAEFVARRRATVPDSPAAEPVETQPMLNGWGSPEPKRLDARAVEHRRRMLQHLAGR